MINKALQLYKNAYTGLSRESWYLSIVMFINRSGTMVVPFMTIYCTQKLHFSIVQAGIIMSLFGAGAITGAFIGGKITDRIGFYYLQVAALLSGGLLFLSISFVQSFWLLCAGAFILSLCNDSFRPANSTAIAHYSNEQTRTRSYSLNRLAVNLGWAFGGSLGGFLASYNYHLLFYVDGFTNIFAALLLLKLLPPVKKTATAKILKESPVIQSAYRDKIYLAFIFLTVIFASCFFQLFTMQPVFFKTQWHFDEQFIGFLMALNGIIIVCTEMVLIHRLEGTKPELHFISIGVLLVGIGYALFNLLPAMAWVAIFSVCIITLGEMLSMPFMNSFWISRTTENNRGEYAALHTMAWSAAQILAPVYGSMLIARGGYDLLWWVLAGICVLSSLGYLAINRINILKQWKLKKILLAR